MMRFTSSWLAAALLAAVSTTGIDLAAQTRARAAAPAAPRDACAAPANRIVAENCKPGNPSTEWDVNGTGDPTIQGFATDISYNVGETARFKIQTDSARYRVDIYRTGYYGGLGARLITTVRPAAPLPQRQPACAADYTVALYDCGTWAVSASWDIPADAVSGVYVARLVREDGNSTWRADNSTAPGPRPEAAPHAYGASGMGKLRNALKEPRASHIVFVVRDDASKSDVLMQTSDPSWTAYNSYGLGSTYNLPGTGGSWQFRAYKVSLNRPLGQRNVNQYFNAEYALSRWLERNGYDVSYFAGVDTDRRGHLLKNHKLFISIGHDEYWSGAQRTNAEAARDAGVNLAFMSGNEVFWKIRYEDSIDGSKTPYRTLVVYKESHTNQNEIGDLQPGRKIDPLKDVWTGHWRDASPFNPEGPQPENALMGTIFTVNANQQDSLVVPAKYGKLRFWRNTEVAALKEGEQVILGNGILGHEWDEDLDNGFRPAGLIRMSETTVDGVAYAQDDGSVFDSGTATHHLTLYRAPSGALVFGGGCVQYSWGLDDFHDNPTARGVNNLNPYSIRLGSDPYGSVKAIQQATLNLFADMGIQPANRQPDLVPATPSTDKRAPLSRIASPASGAMVQDGEVTISGTATDLGGGLVAGVEVSTDAGKSWHPASGTDRWSYTWKAPSGSGSATILSRATDDSVNMEVPQKGITVTYASK